MSQDLADKIRGPVKNRGKYSHKGIGGGTGLNGRAKFSPFYDLAKDLVGKATPDKTANDKDKAMDKNFLYFIFSSYPKILQQRSIVFTFTPSHVLTSENTLSPV